MEWDTVVIFAGSGFLVFFLFWYFFIDSPMTKGEYDRQEREITDRTEAFTKAQTGMYSTLEEE